MPMIPLDPSVLEVRTQNLSAGTRADELVEQFRQDVIAGMQLPHKRIPSRYFYNARGDELFQQIMASPDYYLTRCEAEIFRTQNSAIARALAEGKSNFEVIELGAGDGSKTMRLLKKWHSRKQMPVYRPIDISTHVLHQLEVELKKISPELDVRTLPGEYFAVLDDMVTTSGEHKVFLFLGSNIGNLEPVNSVGLLRRIAGRMEGEDRLLIGFDLKKDPRIIRRAYDDRAGITRQFNFNLLHRINDELGADLHLDQFSHEPIYDPQQGKAMSFMVSKQEQIITIPGAPAPIVLRAWEAIQTESSYKYDMAQIEAIAHDAGLRVMASFMDRKKYFADVVMCLH